MNHSFSVYDGWKAKNTCVIWRLSCGLQIRPHPLTHPLAANWLPHRLAARVCWYNSVQPTGRNEQQLRWYELSAIVLPLAWSRWLKRRPLLFLACFPHPAEQTLKTIWPDVVDWTRRFGGHSSTPLATTTPLRISPFFSFMCSLFRRGAERPFRQFKLLSQAPLQERSGKNEEKKKHSQSPSVCEQPFGRLKRLWIVDLS